MPFSTSLPRPVSRTNRQKRHIVGHGFALRINGLKFDPNKDHTYCRICGDVYQSELDRNYTNLEEWYEAMERRRAWSHSHSKLHGEREHLALAQSGLWVTPEAASKLAAFGIIPISDMVLNEEVSCALAESNPYPTEDSQE